MNSFARGLFYLQIGAEAKTATVMKKAAAACSKCEQLREPAVVKPYRRVFQQLPPLLALVIATRIAAAGK
jgi:hypothetical protein